MSNTPEQLQRRLNEIQNFRTPLKRLVGLVLHEIATNYPEPAALLVGINLDVIHGQFVGMGNDAVVVREDETTVTKVHHQSLRDSIVSKRSEAARRQSEYTTLASHLGKFVLPQQSFVDTHHLFNDAVVVQTVQPYRKLTDTELFYKDNPNPSRAALEKMREYYPAAVAQLPDFIGASFALYDGEGIVPDTQGQGNLSVDNLNGQLLLIDAQPTTRTDTLGQARTLTQLERLGSLLEAVV